MKRNHLDDDRVQLLDLLNREIGAEKRDLHIGPSYLMRPEVDRPGGLERVWKFDILPVLEEHFYGELTRRQVDEKFGLSALRVRLESLEASNQLDDDTL